jgi:hypothetical protein
MKIAMQTQAHATALRGANSARHDLTSAVQRPFMPAGCQGTRLNVHRPIDATVENSPSHESDRPSPWWHSIA